jgi:hypothetical protein
LIITSIWLEQGHKVIMVAPAGVCIYIYETSMEKFICLIWWTSARVLFCINLMSLFWKSRYWKRTLQGCYVSKINKTTWQSQAERKHCNFARHPAAHQILTPSLIFKSTDMKHGVFALKDAHISFSFPWHFKCKWSSFVFFYCVIIYLTYLIKF